MPFSHLVKIPLSVLRFSKGRFHGRCNRGEVRHGPMCLGTVGTGHRESR